MRSGNNPPVDAGGQNLSHSGVPQPADNAHPLITPPTDTATESHAGAATKSNENKKEVAVTTVLPNKANASIIEDTNLAKTTAFDKFIKNEVNLDNVMSALKNILAATALPESNVTLKQNEGEKVIPTAGHVIKTATIPKGRTLSAAILATKPDAPSAGIEQEMTTISSNVPVQFEYISKSDKPLVAGMKETAFVEDTGATVFVHLGTGADRHIARIEPARSWKIKFALIPLLLAAGVEVADVMASLMSANKSYYIVYPAALIAFLAQFGLTGKPMQDYVAIILDIIKHGSLPTKNNRKLTAENEEWPDLYGKYDELKALVPAVIVGLMGMYANGSSAYYIMNTAMNTIPGGANYINTLSWSCTAGLFATGYAITSLCTETFSFFIHMRKVIAGKQDPHTNAYINVIAWILGGPFAIINALSDSASAIAGITKTWNINGNPGYWLTAVPVTLCIGSQKFFFEGTQLVRGVYNTIDYGMDLAKRRATLSATLALTFLACMALPAFLETCKQNINRSFYETFMSDITDVSKLLMAIQIYSYLSVIGYILIGAVSLQPEIQPAVEVTAEKASQLKENAVDACLGCSESAAPDARGLLADTDDDPEIGGSINGDAPAEKELAAKRKESFYASNSLLPLFANKPTVMGQQASQEKKPALPSFCGVM